MKSKYYVQTLRVLKLGRLLKAVKLFRSICFAMVCLIEFT